VPRRGEGRRTQARPEPRGFVRTRLRNHGGFLLQRGEQEQGCHLERIHAVRLPLEPEKVHPGHEDGVRGSQEAGRSRGFDCVPQGRDQVSKKFSEAGRRARVLRRRERPRTTTTTPSSFSALVTYFRFCYIVPLHPHRSHFDSVEFSNSFRPLALSRAHVK